MLSAGHHQPWKTSHLVCCAHVDKPCGHAGRLHEEPVLLHVHSVQPRVSLGALALQGSLLGGHAQWLGLILQPRHDTLAHLQVSLSPRGGSVCSSWLSSEMYGATQHLLNSVASQTESQLRMPCGHASCCVSPTSSEGGVSDLVLVCRSSCAPRRPATTLAAPCPVALLCPVRCPTVQ